jgi:hypothetical protein
MQKQLNKASTATYFMQGNGPNYSFKVGKSTSEAKDVAENIIAALPQALGYVSVHDKIKFSKV